MADVFVSYSRADRARITGVSDAIEQSGLSVWWDRSLAPGDDYAMKIEREIDAASCVVVAWSQTARQSLWVRAEANEALDAGKLVQINLDRARPPLPFTMLHLLDFSGWSGGRGQDPWPQLDDRISRLKRGEPLQEAPAEARLGPPAQGLEKIAWLGWASILVAGLVALAIAMAASGRLAPEAFGVLAQFALAAAAALLALTAFALARIAQASRR